MRDVDVSKRSFFKTVCCGALGLAAGMGGRPAPAAEHPRAGLSADEALATLKKGNENFVSGTSGQALENRMRRLEIARGQAPFAVLVGCSDSRVPPELLFERGLGELFIVRVAGNTVDDVALGSIEYAVAELGVPLVVVLGHERCGAVQAAVAMVEEGATFPGSIDDMVAPIVPAVLEVRDEPGELLDNAVRANVRRVVEELKESGPILMDALARGRLQIVGARYDLNDGTVEFFED